MSLHDVISELLHRGFPKTEDDRDRLLAAVEDDRAAQAVKDRPQVVAAPETTITGAPVRYDPSTGERVP